MVLRWSSGALLGISQVSHPAGAAMLVQRARARRRLARRLRVEGTTEAAGGGAAGGGGAGGIGQRRGDERAIRGSLSDHPKS